MITDGDGLSLVATALLGLWCLAGWGPVRRARHAEPAAVRSMLSASLGLLLAGLGLGLLSAIGVSWSPAAVWGLALVSALGGLGLAERTGAAGAGRGHFPTFRSALSSASSSIRSLRPEVMGSVRTIELLVLAGAASLFAAASALRMNVHADYVYHWGQKAARFALAGGVDLKYLAQPWNAYLHPDYPSLLPALHAAAFNAAGLGWPVAAVLATAFFVLLLFAIRALADAAAKSAPGAALASIVAALGATAFAVGFRQAGGADVIMAAAVTAAVCVLVRPATRGSDFDVAVVAALLAAVKLEGLPAAAALLALHALRRVSAEPGARVRTALATGLRSAGPTAVVVGVWAWLTFGHGLFLESNTGAFDAARLPTVLAGLVKTALLPDWWGLPLVLAALPALALHRRLRFAALLLLAQLLFYVYSYTSGPVDTVHWIATSAARLLFHLVPAALVLAIAAADHWTEPLEED